MSTQDYPCYEIITVDNNSNDGSADFIATHFPRTLLIRSKKNLGYSGGNNLGLTQSKGDLIVVLNPDTVVPHTWLSDLVNTRLAHGSPCIVASKIVLFSNPELINACGNSIHFSCLVFCKGFTKHLASYCTNKELLAPSGASFMIDRVLLSLFGFMDEEFSLMGDTDLALRNYAYKNKCLLSPAITLHKFKLKMSPMRYYTLERERYLLLIKNINIRTNKLNLLCLIFTEIITFSFAILKGKKYVMSKIYVYDWFLHSYGTLIKKYSKRNCYGVSDKPLFCLMDSDISIPCDFFLNTIIKKIIMIAEIGINCLYSILYKITLYLI